MSNFGDALSVWTLSLFPLLCSLLTRGVFPFINQSFVAICLDRLHAFLCCVLTIVFFLNQLNRLNIQPQAMTEEQV